MQGSARSSMHRLLLVVGLSLVFVPWLAFTHKITGRYLLCVNRSPSLNLFVGNQLVRDGWRAYPFQPGIPDSVAPTVSEILAQATAAPVSFLSLELRKIPRLWLGVWNEFQYPVFGIPVLLQEMIHQLILGLAACGFVVLVTKPGSRQTKDTVVALLSAILVVHSLYVGVEPISRYAMTALPAIFMLAGYTISTLWTKPRALLFCIARFSCQSVPCMPSTR